MKASTPLAIQDSLVPAPFIFDKLKSLIQDEQLKSLDLLSLIKIDPCLTVQFLNFPILLDPQLKQRPTSLEAAAAQLSISHLIKFIQLELLKAQSFPYSPGFQKSYMSLWESALFCACFLEIAAPFIQVDPHFAYTLGLLHAIDSIVESSLLHLHQQDLHIAKLKEPSIILKQSTIPEALLCILVQHKEAHLETHPLATCLDLAIQLKEGKNVEKLRTDLGIELDLLPGLCRKTQKRLSAIYRFIAVF